MRRLQCCPAILPSAGSEAESFESEKVRAGLLVPRSVDRLEFILTLEFSPTRGRTDGPEPASAIKRLTHAPLRNAQCWALKFPCHADARAPEFGRRGITVWLVPDSVGASQHPSHTADSSGRS
jgi:hypothetical protein